MAADVLVATRSALVMYDGRQRMIRAGRTFARAGHPILEDHTGLFEPVKVEFELEAENEGQGGDAKSRRTRKPKRAGDDTDAEDDPES